SPAGERARRANHHRPDMEIAARPETNDRCRAEGLPGPRISRLSSVRHQRRGAERPDREGRHRRHGEAAGVCLSGRQGPDQGAGTRLTRRGHAMNAPVKVVTARPLPPLVDILKILAESGAASWELFPLDLPDVVDPLQYFAERTGLVATLGEDNV